jgi:hypothetical protein
MLPRLEYFFRRDFEQDAHLTGLAVAVFLLSKVALYEFLEVKVGPFWCDFNNTATNPDGTLPSSRGVNDTDHDTRIALDIASLLMTLDGVDENERSIGVDPCLRDMRRAIRHDGRENEDRNRDRFPECEVETNKSGGN